MLMSVFSSTYCSKLSNNCNPLAFSANLFLKSFYFFIFFIFLFFIFLFFFLFIFIYLFLHLFFFIFFYFFLFIFIFFYFFFDKIFTLSIDFLSSLVGVNSSIEFKQFFSNCIIMRSGGISMYLFSDLKVFLFSASFSE